LSLVTLEKDDKTVRHGSEVEVVLRRGEGREAWEENVLGRRWWSSERMT
jgi:hypothetical protein